MILKSKINFLLLFTLIIGGFIFSVVSYYLLKNSFEESFFLFIPIFFCIISLYALISLLFIENITINNFYLEIKNIFGKIKKKILLSEIESYSTLILKSKRGFTEEKLILFTNDNNYEFSDMVYRNFGELKQVLIKEKKRNYSFEEYKKIKGYNFVGWIYITLGIILLSINLYLNSVFIGIESPDWIMPIIFSCIILFGIILILKRNNVISKN